MRFTKNLWDRASPVLMRSRGGVSSRPEKQRQPADIGEQPVGEFDLASSDSLLHVTPELDVDPKDVFIQPPVDGVDEFLSVRGQIATRFVALPIIAKGREEHRVSFLVLVGCRTAILLHTLFLEAEVVAAECGKGTEE